MAYYVITKDKEGKHKSLSIENSSLFKLERKFKKPRAHTLQEIDSFTSAFEDEQELKEHLITEGILSPELISNPLSIRFIKQDNYDSIKYDLLYQDSIEYIMEIERLIEIILKRYHNDDFIFIKKLASRFLNFHECKTTAPELVGLSEMSIQTGRRETGFNELDSNGDNMVSRLIKLLILKHTEKPNGEIEYKNKCNYRNLHILITFVLNYDKNLKEDILESPIPEIKKIEEQPIEPVIYKSKGYTRTRKLTPELAGQISIKDLI